MREIHRSTFREIKSSLGRFMAILAIIALGVGFFAGLKVCRASMVGAVKEYLDVHKFYDFRLLSTMGFADGDAEALRAQADVEAAEGAVSLDVLYQLEDGTQGAVKAHSLTETVNRVELVYGRFPEADDECLADSSMFGEAALGSRIYLSKDNEEDTLELFAHDAYTIVGIAQSPLYIQYERGNTSLGAGRLSGFLYLPREGFDMDFDTEIYVRFAQGNALYGEAYDAFCEEKEAWWEELADRAAGSRYQKILADARGELADARQEFWEKKAEGEEELADAEAALADAREEFADGELALADARREIEDGKRTIREKEEELADGRHTLEEKEQELLEGEEELAGGEREWSDSRSRISVGWSSLNAQKGQLQGQRADLESQSAELESQSAELEEQWAELERQRAELERQSAELEEQKAELERQSAELERQKTELESQKAGLEAQKAELEAQWAELERQKEELESRFAELEEQSAELESRSVELEEQWAESELQKAELQSRLADLKKQSDELDLKEKELDGLEAALTAGMVPPDQEEAVRGQLENGRNQMKQDRLTIAYLRGQLETGLTQLEAGRGRIEAGLTQLEASRQELAGYLTQLEAGRGQLETGLTQIGAGRQELAGYLSQLEAGLTQLEAGRREIAGYLSQLEAGLTQIGAGRQEIAGYLTQLEAGRQELAGYREQIEAGGQIIASYERQVAEAERQLRLAEEQLAEGRRELDEAAEELSDGRQAISEAKEELAAGERELADAGRELAEAEETLAEKEAELAEAREELAEGEREYADALEEFDREISDAEEKLAEAEADLEGLEAPDTYVLGRDTNIGYVCFENDSNIVDGIANIFPAFFFLVAALVCITTMNRMVEEQRTQIGVLKALGYGNVTIMSKYMTYSGLAAEIGCVSGFFLGTWGFPRIIWFVYGIMYKAGDVSYVFDWRLALISLAVSLLCSIGTTWLSCRAELGHNAAQLMRPKAPKAGKRVFLERIPFLWRRLSFLRKVSVRNIFRYKKRLFMMVLGISGCTALLVTGFGIDDSIADVATQQFEEVQTYDISVSLQEAAGEEIGLRLAELSGQGLAEALCVMERNMDLITEKGVKSVYLVAAEGEEISPYLNMHTRAGEEIAYPGFGECVITRKLAEQYDIGVGDTVTLRAENMESLSARVTAVMENYIYSYVYLSGETWRDGMGEEPERKTVYVNLAAGADAHRLAAALMDLEEVASVSVNADMMERIGSMMESLNVIVVVVILCAGGLAFIVLYNLTNINITERIREIATVKVLGFYKRETASYVFRENILLTLMGMCLGLVLGHFLHALVMNEIQVDMIAFDIHVRPVSYLYSALLTVAFAWLVNLAMGGKLERVSMTESLKSVD